MQASLEQLSQIIVFAGLEIAEKISLQPYTQVQRHRKAEIILSEGSELVLSSISQKFTILFPR
ncbi:MAG: hypothetical protein V7L02_22865 [Nostoc sp.]|uniref:hypothetical protein n=1 Tax=Nostoc sp. TaxID=1180 RepID=UPI002FF76D4F